MLDIHHVINAVTGASVALLLTAGPALASGEITCTATDGSDAAISMVVGHLPVLNVLRVEATDGAETWVTDATGTDHPIVFGQGFMDDRQVYADFTDPNVERIAVSLRLFQGNGYKTFAQAGILSFEGTAVYPVQCING